MGGSKSKQANENLSNQATYQTEQQKSFDSRNATDLDQAKEHSNSLYDALSAGYSGLSANSQNSQGGSGGGGGGGGAADTRFSDVDAKYREFMETGGWESGVRTKQEEIINSLNDIGKTGGISDEDKYRARGLGVYDEYAKTGGLTDKDIANMRSRATSGIPGFYGQMKQESQRQAAVQGGYGPGLAAMQSRLSRQQAGAAADASLNAELGIRDKINEGRKWGASGASSSELSLQDLLSKNKLAGLTGAGDINSKMMESIMGGREWGTSGLTQRAESDRQASMAASAQSAASDKWEREFSFRQNLAGLEGLSSLYSSSPSEYQQDKQMALGSASAYGNQVTGANSAMKGGKTWKDYLAQYGAVAGAGAATYFTGGAAAPALGAAVANLRD